MNPKYEVKCDFKVEVDTLDEALNLVRLLSNTGARYVIIGMRRKWYKWYE